MEKYISELDKRSSMTRVGINGFGTIGKRIADAIRAQPNMEVAGVAKRTPNYEAKVACDRGYPLFVSGEEAHQFTKANMDVAGRLRELVDNSDVIIDATPAGVGDRYRTLYEDLETPAVFQGGEDASIASVSFNARANYSDAVDANTVRVVSCNTTGLSRLLAPIDEHFGVEKVQATLIRRGDPSQSDCGPINDTLPDPISIPSHHASDVQTVFPELDIDTMGVKVPTTQMHLHAINISLNDAPDAEAVQEILSKESRLMLIPKHLAIDGTGKLKEYARDAGRFRGDIWGKLYLGRFNHYEIGRF